MDELAYALSGENAHYGTPVNVAAPGRVPGGSTSGPAVSLMGIVRSMFIAKRVGSSYY